MSQNYPPGDQRPGQPPHGQQPPGPQQPYYPPPGQQPYQQQPPPAPRKRRRWPWILGAIVLLFVIVGVSNSGGETSSTPAAPPGSTGVADPPGAADTGDTDDAPTRYGQTVDRDGLQLTATEPEPGDATIRPTLCTTVSYVNNTGRDQPFNAFDWKVRDGNGAEVGPGFLGSTNPLQSGNLTPGGKVSGPVCFDKPGSDVAAVVYAGSLFGEPVTWTG